jgi:hypothetical protein
VTLFTDHFTTRHGTTNNCRAISYLHTLQITATNTMSSPPCNVFTSRFLVTASNNGDPSASALKSFPALYHLATQLLCKLVPSITLWHGPRRRHIFSIVACVFTALLRSNGRLWTTENIALLLLLVCILRLLPGNGRCLQSHSLATGLYATVYFNGMNNLRF